MQMARRMSADENTDNKGSVWALDQQLDQPMDEEAKKHVQGKATDESVLDVDQVENLIKFFPTKEEMELLKNYTGDKETLGKCEQYFLELMKVPRVESKLRVFSFKIQFGSQVSEFKKSLNTVKLCMRGGSELWKVEGNYEEYSFLGNTLNQGTARANRRLLTSIPTPESSGGAFPSNLLSAKPVVASERTKGLCQDLVIPVTNFHYEDKGFTVLPGDVFDVTIRKDIVHQVVLWQLAKRQQGLNVYSILQHDTLVMSRAAVNEIVERMHTPIKR